MSWSDGQVQQGGGSLVTAVDPDVALFGLFGLFGRMVEHAVRKTTYVDALADAIFHSRIARSPVGQEAVQALVARAESAGAVRDDIGVAELIALIVGASRAAEHAGQDGALRARILQIVFDRFRPVERSLR